MKNKLLLTLSRWLMSPAQKMAAESTLQQRAPILSSVLNNTAEGIIVTDEAGTFLLFNPAAERLLQMRLWGRSIADWARRYDCYLPDKTTFYPIDKLPPACALRGETVDDAEIFLRTTTRPDGLWLSVSARPWKDEQGNIRGSISVFRDFTASRNAQDRNLQLAALVEQSDDGIVGMTLDGIVTAWNRGAERMFGYTAAEMVGHSIVQLIPADQLHEFPELLTRVRRGESVRHHDTVRSRKDGRRLSVALTLSPIKDRTGAIMGASEIARDVSEQKRMEDILKESNLFLDSLVENIPNMVFAKDARDLRFIRFNRAGEELLGFNRDELIGKNDFDFFPKEQAEFFTAKDREVLNSGWLVDIPEEPIQTRSHGPRILHTKKIPVFDDMGNPLYLLGISEDITEAKEREKSLQEKQRELVRTNAEREQLELFAYVAGHDLQEPLHKIIAFGDLLNAHAGGMIDQKGRDYLERMQNAAKRMRRLIEDLLRFSRISTREDFFEPVDLNAIVRDVLTDLELRINESNARISIEALPVISGSRMQLHELFQNLIANALKFRKPGTPPNIRVRSRDARQDGRDFWEISVKDDGIGFDVKFTEKIFRPFERLHRRGEYDGSGVGLAICSKIVRRHGGRVTAHSLPGKGSTFIVTLPKGESPEEPAPPEAKSDAGSVRTSMV